MRVYDSSDQAQTPQWAPSTSDTAIPGSRSLSSREIGNGNHRTVTIPSPVVKVWEREEPEPRPEVVEGLIPEKSTTIVYADGGTGKSLWVLHLLTCALTGKRFAGRHVQKVSSVLYIDAELDETEFTRRAYAVARGLGLEGPPMGLHYWNLSGPLSDPRVHEEARNLIAACNAELFALDSLTIASYGTDAKEQADMTAILKQIEQWGSTGLLIDHPPAPRPGVNTSAYRPFGTTFKYNLARSVLQIIRVDGGGLALRQTKHNFGPLSEPISMAMVFDGDAIRFEVVDVTDERMTGLENHLPAGERVFQALAQHGTTGATAQELAADLEIASKTVSNHLTTLKNQGRASNKDGQWFSRSSLSLGTRNGNSGASHTMEAEADDPRPDLLNDHLPWCRLLHSAWLDSGDDANGAYGVLHGIRCDGARLVQRNGKWQIVSDSSENDWNEDWCTWLLPHQETVDRLLSTLDGSSLREAV